MSPKVVWNEEFWIKSIQYSQEEISTQFVGLVNKVAQDLENPKNCLKTISEIFEKTQGSLWPNFFPEKQKRVAQSAVEMVEGLVFAVEGCVLKKGDKSLVPKGTEFQKGMEKVAHSLQLEDSDRAKIIFRLLARHILKKGGKISYFEDLHIPLDYGSRTCNWAIALQLLAKKVKAVREQEMK